MRAAVLLLIVFALAGCGSTPDRKLEKRVAYVEAEAAKVGSDLIRVRSELGVLEREHAAETEAKLRRLQGCIPELVAYVDAIEASLGGGGGDPTKQITAACMSLFFPEGLPLN